MLYKLCFHLKFLSNSTLSLFMVHLFQLKKINFKFMNPDIFNIDIEDSNLSPPINLTQKIEKKNRVH